MRVLQVIYSFAVGGSEMVASNIAQNLGEGCTHGIAALEFDGPLREGLENAGVQTWIIDRQPNERLSPMVRLWKVMRQFKPDVVHTHHLYQLVYALAGARLTGTPIVHTEHEYYSLMQPKTAFLLKNLSPFCRFVTGVNTETTEFLRDQIGIPERKIRTIVNGINLKQYKSCLENGKLDDFKEWVGKDLLVGVVARLDPVKDHAMLVRAFREVVDRQPNSKLVIIGDGETRPQLEEMVCAMKLDDKVRFLGNRSDVPELLSCLDVLALSSINEGLPLSILEGMAAGNPVVATDVGGVATVVKPGETGLLVPAGNHEKMATAIQTLLGDSGMAKKMGENGRRLIEQNYDLKKTLADYLALYRGHK